MECEFLFKVAISNSIPGAIVSFSLHYMIV